MILSALLNIIAVFLKLIFLPLPAIPQVAFVTNILTFFNNTILKGLKLFLIFIRPSTVVTAMSIAIVIFIFKHTYGFILWVVKKIPFLGIK